MADAAPTCPVCAGPVSGWEAVTEDFVDEELGMTLQRFLAYRVMPCGHEIADMRRA